MGPPTVGKSKIKLGLAGDDPGGLGARIFISPLGKGSRRRFSGRTMCWLRDSLFVLLMKVVSGFGQGKESPQNIIPLWRHAMFLTQNCLENQWLQHRMFNLSFC